MGGRTEFVEHPYTPYPIQQQFMEALYQALEDSAVGLFESPTGTGKTISIICGALHWLEDFRQRAREADAAQASGGADDEDPDWLRAHQVNANTNIATEQHPWLKNRCLDATGSRRVIQLQNLGAVGAHRSWLTSGKGATGVEVVGAAARAAIDTVNSSGGVKAQRGDEDEQFLLAPTTTDGSGGAGDGGNSIEMRRARMRALLGDDGSSEEGASGEEADDLRAAIRALRAQPAAPIRKPQIFFASRTHSQLAQFVGELRRTGFASRLRLVSLASRRGLCINEPVVALGAAGLITERCTELQERRKGSRSSNKMRRIATCSDGNCNGGCGVASCADGGPVRPAPGPGSRGRASRGPGGGTGSGGGCPFLTPSLEAAEEFAGMILREPMDVEDLGRAGRRLGLCPYYGSRSLVSEADVVALPYSALLSQETCALLGLRLEGAVVIFDEAHNLVDAVTGTHGSQVTLEQLKIATRQLSAYFSRFQLRLSPTSARNVQLLMRLVSSLQRCLEQQLQVQVSEQRPNDTVVAAEGAGTSGACCSGGVEVLGTHDFLLATRMEHMNLFPLLSWVRESRLVMKVAGYDMATSGTETSIVPEATVGLHDDKGKEVAARGAQSATAGHEGRSGAASGGGPAVAGGGGFGARRSSLFAVISFLTSLTQPNADGRIVISRAASGGGSSSTDGGTVACLRYTVLNAAAHFASIVQSARSVILASGTLSPVEGLLAQLLPDVPPHRVRFFSCGHVVPPENLLTLVAACGPTGQNLDLRHCRRSDPHISEELGRLLINICTAVPAGVVVFAPSFAYLDQLIVAWRRSDVWSGLTFRKHVFVEPRSTNEVEAVLESYAAAIKRTTQPPPATTAATAAATAAAGMGMGTGRRPNGAVLLSVVGGKLSEGINFGDDLGRCVVVLGLPYPNPSEPELRERMRYLDEAAATTLRPASTATVDTGAALATAAKGITSDNAGGTRSAPRETLDARIAATSFPSSGMDGCATKPPGTAPTMKPNLIAAGGNNLVVAAPASPTPLPRLTGRQYYEGLCIKAVNQCVGRVIRHARDYAAVVLVDARYMPQPRGVIKIACGSSGGIAYSGAGGGVVSALPTWIQQSVRPGAGDFPHVYSNLVRFFRGRTAVGASSGGYGPQV